MTSSGHVRVVVMIDHKSKFLFAVAVRNNSENIARIAI